MSLKTKEHDGGLRRQLCVCPHNDVQLCMGHVRGEKNYLLRSLLPGEIHSYRCNVPDGYLSSALYPNLPTGLQPSF